ncbi:MAG: hypothetical protein H6661_02115 [Ardenticatenaceae bacterium]|nr:hypothetical protein [Ardenticatenaceae bacterium]
MNNRMRIALFSTNFAIFVTGMGLLPVLPLYAAQFGASQTVIGLYLASTYASIAAGSLLTNRLLNHLPLRVLRRSGLIGALAPILLAARPRPCGRVVVLTGLIWFTGGIGPAPCSADWPVCQSGHLRQIVRWSAIRPACWLACWAIAVGQFIARQGYLQASCWPRWLLRRWRQRPERVPSHSRAKDEARGGLRQGTA